MSIKSELLVAGAAMCDVTLLHAGVHSGKVDEVKDPDVVWYGLVSPLSSVPFVPGVVGCSDEASVSRLLGDPL